MQETKLRAVAVDDEIHCLKTFEFEMNRSCPEVEIVATFQNAEEAREYLSQADIEVLFLDIHLQSITGIQLLESLMPVSYDVIFVTAYDEYAIKAFDLSAMHYLMKPINKNKLRSAVDKVIDRRKKDLSSEYVEMLTKLKKEISGSNRIGVPVQEGIEFIDPDTILYIKADSNYSIFNFTNRKSLVVSKTLKLLEDDYLPSGFMRIHKSHIINVKELIRYVKSDGGYVVMSDGTQLEVSRNKRQIMSDLY